MPRGTVFMYHAQERAIDVPIAETSGKRGGIHNSLTRLLMKPTHLAGGSATSSPGYVDATRRWSTDEGDGANGDGDDPDKCIGCHTCSVTCKQAWTNRSGVVYGWFNNVETRPGSATRALTRTRSAGRAAGR